MVLSAKSVAKSVLQLVSWARICCYAHLLDKISVAPHTWVVEMREQTGIEIREAQTMRSYTMAQAGLCCQHSETMVECV